MFYQNSGRSSYMNFQRVTNFLDSLHKIGVPGADLAVYIKGNEVYRHQTDFSDRNTCKPIAPDALYRIYSMTKVITCVAAMRLYEEGLFLLSDPVYKYLPEFEDMTVRHVKKNGEEITAPAKNPIRVVDLFTMTSGLTYNLTPKLEELFKSNGNYTPEEFSEAISKDPLFFEPGKHWQYGYSHDILGCLIQKLSGKTLGDYFNDNIFGPLGMTDTFFWIPKEKEHRLTPFYFYDEESEEHTEADPTTKLQLRFDLNKKYESPGAGLFSTIDDYAKFTNALYYCFCSSDSDQVKSGTDRIGSCNYHLLSKPAAELMRTNHLGKTQLNEYQNWNNQSGYGYGLGVRTLLDKSAAETFSSIGEFGWAGLAGTYMLIDPAVDLTYVYAQQSVYTRQSSPSYEERIARRLRNVIYGCL